jgi:hypothetical protein
MGRVTTRLRTSAVRTPVLLGAAFLLVVIVTAAIARLGPGEHEVRAGDCLEVLQEQTAAGAPPGTGPVRQIYCGDPAAAYQVGVRLDGLADCPAQIYTVRRDAEGFTLCLMYNVRAGQCFLESPAQTGSFDCAEGPRAGAIKILKRVDGTVDQAQCESVAEPGVLAALIPQPKTTFCYVEFSNGERPPVAT